MAVGFGISKPQHAKAILRGGAKGAILGSGFVDLIGRNLGHMDRALKELATMARKLKNDEGRYLEYEITKGRYDLRITLGTGTSVFVAKIESRKMRKRLMKVVKVWRSYIALFRLYATCF